MWPQLPVLSFRAMARLAMLIEFGFWKSTPQKVSDLQSTAYSELCLFVLRSRSFRFSTNPLWRFELNSGGYVLVRPGIFKCEHQAAQIQGLGIKRLQV